MAYRDLCRPCMEELKNRKLVMYASGGVNNKVTCAVCGRRRYGCTYLVKSMRKEVRRANREKDPGSAKTGRTDPA
ncbi:MAG: hypothetical protein J5633_04710 [Oscillospiraceae bacterium]|nr:hypothetical protein [Oscillospiraceae bacterium]